MTGTHQQWRKNQYYAYDPHSEDIAPALLNSADIKTYIDMGCIIAKDSFDSELLKPASYEMRFLGKLYDWTINDEGQLKPRCREICPDKPTILYQNSITYLWMKEKLFLPEYIAARFNLHIRHVHKGLLLGTGPLVDPGFSGNLLIPLHNLTDNDYEIIGGNGFIWVEFTKLTHNEFWRTRDKSSIERPPDLKMFPSVKDLDDPNPYFVKSGVTGLGGVQSAFRGALDKTKAAVEEAKQSAAESRDYTKKITRMYTWGGVISLLLIALAVGTIIFQGYSLVNQVVTAKGEVHRPADKDREVGSVNADTVMERISNLEKRLEEAGAHINDLRGEVDLMNQEQGPAPKANQ